MWTTTVCALSVVISSFFTRLMGAPVVYGLRYPLGTTIGAYICLRSWIRGRNVEWKGRRYRVRRLSDDL